MDKPEAENAVPSSPLTDGQGVGLKPWGFHAGDGSPAHPAQRVQGWTSGNRARMTQAVYSLENPESVALNEEIVAKMVALEPVLRELMSKRELSAAESAMLQLIGLAKAQA